MVSEITSIYKRYAVENGIYKIYDVENSICSTYSPPYIKYIYAMESGNSSTHLFSSSHFIYKMTSVFSSSHFPSTTLSSLGISILTILSYSSYFRLTKSNYFCFSLAFSISFHYQFWWMDLGAFV